MKNVIAFSFVCCLSVVGTVAIAQTPAPQPLPYPNDTQRVIAEAWVCFQGANAELEQCLEQPGYNRVTCNLVYLNSLIECLQEIKSEVHINLTSEELSYKDFE